eukprot:gene1134-1238_t
MNALLYFSSTIPSLFPIIEDRYQIRNDSAGISQEEGNTTRGVGYCVLEGKIIYFINNTITFGDWDESPGGQVGEVRIEAEVEFDAVVTMAVWDQSGSVAAVSDANGSLHLVKKDGSILLSKQLLGGLALKSLQFLQYEDQHQALVGITSSGNVLCISRLDMVAMCQPGNLMAALKNIKFAKWSLPVQSIAKAIVLQFSEEGGQSSRLVVLTEEGELSHFAIDATGSAAIVDDWVSIENSLAGQTVADIHYDSPVLFVATMKGDLLSVEMSSCSLLDRFSLGIPLQGIDLVEKISSKDAQPSRSLFGWIVSLRGPEKGDVHSLTCLFALERKLFLVVPHGRMELSHASDSTMFLPSYTTSGSREVMVRSEESFSQLFLSFFSAVSKALASDIFHSLLELIESHTEVVTLPGQLPFGSFLGRVLYYVFFVTEKSADCVELFLQKVLSLRFGPEVVLSTSFLLKAIHLPLAVVLKTVLNHLESSHQFAENKLFECQAIFKQWQFLCDTTSLLHSAEDQSSSSLERFLSLLPISIHSTLSTYLEQGDLRPAIVILERHLWKSPVVVAEKEPFMLFHLLTLIPLECVDHRAVLKIADLLLATIAPVVATNNRQEEIYHICSNLLERSQNWCFTQGKECACMEMVAHALRLLTPLPDLNDEIAILRKQLEKLSHDLELQLALQDSLDLYVPMEEIQEFGWDGLICERLDETPVNDMEAFIQDRLRGITESFGVDIDHILYEWVMDKIQTTVASMTCHEEGVGPVLYDDDEESSIGLIIHRLIAVTRVNHLGPLSIGCVLKIFQLCSLSSAKHFSESLNANATETIGLRLTQLATDLIPKATLKEKEELMEAVRLFRIRLLAQQYGIEDIELRDNKQLAAAVAIIANASDRPQSIEDAISFSMEDGMVRTDIRTALIRKLICFITSTPWDDLQYDKQFSFLLSQILPSLLKHILEDALAYCVEEHHEVCAAIDAVLSQRKTSTSARRVDQVDNTPTEVLEKHYAMANSLVKGMIKLAEACVDKISSSSDNKSRAFSATSELLPYYRRLLQLHSQYSLYLSIDQLKSYDHCKEALKGMAIALTETWLGELPVRSSIPSSSGSQHEQAAIAEDLEGLAGSVAKLQKISRLLEVSPQVFVKVITKIMIDKGRKKLAIAFARSHLEETSAMIGNLGQQRSGSTGSAVAQMSEPWSCHGDDWEEVLDTVKIISTATLSTANRQTGYYTTASTSSVMDELDGSHVRAAYHFAQSTLCHAVANCPVGLVDHALDLLDTHDLVLTVYDRIQPQGSGAQTMSYSSSASATMAAHSTPSSSAAGGAGSMSTFIDSIFTHDGLLLTEETVLPPLLQHCAQESKRREQLSAEAKDDSRAAISAGDVENFVRCLQRHENHMLALRVLYRSWNVDLTKAAMIRSSLLALCRKVLTYREVDESLAIACLSALDLDNVVKELKAAVPTALHSDFSRLKIVAWIGEEMAHLWEEDSMLLLFQGLQTHAKWWHILSTILHIQVDLKAFSADPVHQSAYLRSLVPEILIKTGGELEIAADFCHSFDLEPEIAALHYIEYTLSCPPVNTMDTSWMNKVRAAALGLREDALIKTLERVLPRVHEVDYEKICFVCTWLLQLKPEDAEIEESSGLGDEDSHEISTNHSISGSSILVGHNPTTGPVVTATVYQRFIDLTKLLASLGLPRDVHRQLLSTVSPLQDRLKDVYGGSLQESYQHRLPFWMLTSTQTCWELLDLVFMASDWATEKLLPVCVLLEISKEEFFVRAIYAAYLRDSRAAGAATSISTESATSLQLDKIEVSLREHLLSISSQVRVYLMIYEVEHKSGGQQAAVLALQRAILLLQEHGPCEDYNLDDLSSRLLRLKLERSLSKFIAVLDSPLNRSVIQRSAKQGDRLQRIFLPHQLDGPYDAAERALEVAIEFLWEEQMDDCSLLYAEMGGQPSFFRVATEPVGRRVRGSLTTIQAVLVELYQHCAEVRQQSNSQLQNTSTVIGAGDSATMLASSSPAEVSERLVVNFIIQLLLDQRSGSTSNSTSSTTAGAVSTASKTVAGHGGITGSTSSSLAVGGSWGLAEDINPNLPTSAEYRRREDIFIGFAICMLLHLMIDNNSTQKRTIVQQLDQVMRSLNCGFRTINSRKLNGRSRLRATQALSYYLSMHPDERQSELTVAVAGFQRYFLCLAELQEIRVVCSEESLASALSLSSLSTSTGSVDSRLAQSSAQSILLTWLHDESDHEDALELVRDLYILSGLSDSLLLMKIIQKLLLRKQHRALLILLQELQLQHRLSDVICSSKAEEIQHLLLAMMHSAHESFQQSLANGWLLRSAKKEDNLLPSLCWSPSIFLPAEKSANANSNARTAASQSTVVMRNGRFLKRIFFSSFSSLLLPNVEGRELASASLILAQLLGGGLGQSKLADWTETCVLPSLASFASIFGTNLLSNAQSSTSALDDQQRSEKYRKSCEEVLTLFCPTAFFTTVFNSIDALQKLTEGLVRLTISLTEATARKFFFFWWMHRLAAMTAEDELSLEEALYTSLEALQTDEAKHRVIVQEVLDLIRDSKAETRSRLLSVRCCLRLLAKDSEENAVIKSLLDGLASADRQIIFKFITRHLAKLQSYLKGQDNLISLLRSQS